ncbi:hypothetical protein [Saccharopolyspora sp. NPDC050642]|uniref:hypothetical protein n=1 Tax=Saccharopolyspora sp. NPDC050642 TaxID=3157099 RepID=UPI0033E01E64
MFDEILAGLRAEQSAAGASSQALEAGSSQTQTQTQAQAQEQVLDGESHAPRRGLRWAVGERGESSTGPVADRATVAGPDDDVPMGDVPTFSDDDVFGGFGDADGSEFSGNAGDEPGDKGEEVVGRPRVTAEQGPAKADVRSLELTTDGLESLARDLERIEARLESPSSSLSEKDLENAQRLGELNRGPVWNSAVRRGLLPVLPAASSAFTDHVKTIFRHIAAKTPLAVEVVKGTPELAGLLHGDVSRIPPAGWLAVLAHGAWGSGNVAGTPVGPVERLTFEGLEGVARKLGDEAGVARWALPPTDGVPDEKFEKSRELVAEFLVKAKYAVRSAFLENLVSPDARGLLQQLEPGKREAVETFVAHVVALNPFALRVMAKTEAFHSAPSWGDTDGWTDTRAPAPPREVAAILLNLVARLVPAQPESAGSQEDADPIMPAGLRAVVSAMDRAEKDLSIFRELQKRRPVLVEAKRKVARAYGELSPVDRQVLVGLDPVVQSAINRFVAEASVSGSLAQKLVLQTEELRGSAGDVKALLKAVSRGVDWRPLAAAAEGHDAAPEGGGWSVASGVSGDGTKRPASGVEQVGSSAERQPGDEGEGSGSGARFGGLVWSPERVVALVAGLDAEEGAVAERTAEAVALAHGRVSPEVEGVFARLPDDDVREAVDRFVGYVLEGRRSALRVVERTPQLWRATGSAESLLGAVAAGLAWGALEGGSAAWDGFARALARRGASFDGEVMPRSLKMIPEDRNVRAVLDETVMHASTEDRVAAEALVVRWPEGGLGGAAGIQAWHVPAVGELPPGLSDAGFRYSVFVVDNQGQQLDLVVDDARGVLNRFADMNQLEESRPRHYDAALAAISRLLEIGEFSAAYIDGVARMIARGLGVLRPELVTSSDAPLAVDRGDGQDPLTSAEDIYEAAGDLRNLRPDPNHLQAAQGIVSETNLFDTPVDPDFVDLDGDGWGPYNTLSRLVAERIANSDWSKKRLREFAVGLGHHLGTVNPAWWVQFEGLGGSGPDQVGQETPAEPVQYDPEELRDWEERQLSGGGHDPAGAGPSTQPPPRHTAPDYVVGSRPDLEWELQGAVRVVQDNFKIQIGTLRGVSGWDEVVQRLQASDSVRAYGVLFDSSNGAAWGLERGQTELRAWRGGHKQPLSEVAEVAEGTLHLFVIDGNYKVLHGTTVPVTYPSVPSEVLKRGDVWGGAAAVDSFTEATGLDPEVQPFPNKAPALFRSLWALAEAADSFDALVLRDVGDGGVSAAWHLTRQAVLDAEIPPEFGSEALDEPVWYGVYVAADGMRIAHDVVIDPAKAAAVLPRPIAQDVVIDPEEAAAVLPRPIAQDVVIDPEEAPAVLSRHELDTRFVGGRLAAEAFVAATGRSPELRLLGGDRREARARLRAAAVVADLAGVVVATRERGAGGAPPRERGAGLLHVPGAGNAWVLTWKQVAHEQFGPEFSQSEVDYYAHAVDSAGNTIDLDLDQLSSMAQAEYAPLTWTSEGMRQAAQHLARLGESRVDVQRHTEIRAKVEHAHSALRAESRAFLAALDTPDRDAITAIVTYVLYGTKEAATMLVATPELSSSSWRSATSLLDAFATHLRTNRPAHFGEIAPQPTVASTTTAAALAGEESADTAAPPVPVEVDRVITRQQLMENVVGGREARREFRSALRDLELSVMEPEPVLLSSDAGDAWSQLGSFADGDVFAQALIVRLPRSGGAGQAWRVTVVEVRMWVEFDEFPEIFADDFSDYYLYAVDDQGRVVFGGSSGTEPVAEESVGSGVRGDEVDFGVDHPDFAVDGMASEQARPAGFGEIAPQSTPHWTLEGLGEAAALAGQESAGAAAPIPGWWSVESAFGGHEALEEFQGALLRERGLPDVEPEPVLLSSDAGDAWSQLGSFADGDVFAQALIVRLPRSGGAGQAWRVTVVEVRMWVEFDEFPEIFADDFSDYYLYAVDDQGRVVFGGSSGTEPVAEESVGSGVRGDEVDFGVDHPDFAADGMATEQERPILPRRTPDVIDSDTLARLVPGGQEASSDFLRETQISPVEPTHMAPRAADVPDGQSPRPQTPSQQHEEQQADPDSVDGLTWTLDDLAAAAERLHNAEHKRLSPEERASAESRFVQAMTEVENASTTLTRPQKIFLTGLEPEYVEAIRTIIALALIGSPATTEAFARTTGLEFDHGRQADVLLTTFVQQLLDHRPGSSASVAQEPAAETARQSDEVSLPSVEPLTERPAPVSRDGARDESSDSDGSSVEFDGTAADDQVIEHENPGQESRTNAAGVAGGDVITREQLRDHVVDGPEARENFQQALRNRRPRLPDAEPEPAFFSDDANIAKALLTALANAGAFLEAVVVRLPKTGASELDGRAWHLSVERVRESGFPANFEDAGSRYFLYAVGDDGSAVTGDFPIRSLEGDPGAGSSSGPRVGGPGPEEVMGEAGGSSASRVPDGWVGARDRSSDDDGSPMEVDEKAPTEVLAVEPGSGSMSEQDADWVRRMFAGLERRAADAFARGEVSDHPTRGPRLFGNTRIRPVPAVLDVDLMELPLRQVWGLLQRADMIRSVLPDEPFTPEALDEAGRDVVILESKWTAADRQILQDLPEQFRTGFRLPAKREIAVARSAIWLGGPLDGSPRTAKFIEGLAATRRNFNGPMVLFTDVPRADIQALNGLALRGDRLDSVRRMVRIAGQLGMWVVNIDELPLAKVSAPVVERVLMDRTKSSPYGYVQASDALRWLLSFALGNLYLDGDAVLDRPQVFQQVHISDVGYRLLDRQRVEREDTGGFVNNDAILMSRGHPKALGYLGTYARVGELTQIDLFGDRLYNRPADFFDENPKGMFWFDHGSVTGRTGPGLLASVRRDTGKFHLLPGVSGSYANSWAAAVVPSAEPKIAQEDHARSEELVAKVADVLILYLYNRPHDMFYPAVRNLLSRHENPQLVLQAASTFIASVPAFRSRAVSVTNAEFRNREWHHVATTATLEELFTVTGGDALTWRGYLSGPAQLKRPPAELLPEGLITAGGWRNALTPVASAQESLMATLVRWRVAGEAGHWWNYGIAAMGPTLLNHIDVHRRMHWAQTKVALNVDDVRGIIESVDFERVPGGVDALILMFSGKPHVTAVVAGKKDGEWSRAWNVVSSPQNGRPILVDTENFQEDGKPLLGELRATLSEYDELYASAVNVDGTPLTVANAGGQAGAGRPRWDRNLALGMAAHLKSLESRTGAGTDALRAAQAERLRAAYQRFDKRPTDDEQVLAATRSLLSGFGLEEAVEVITLHAWRGAEEVRRLLPSDLPSDLNEFVPAVAKIIALDVAGSMESPPLDHLREDASAEEIKLTVRRRVGQYLTSLHEAASEFANLDDITDEQVREDRTRQLEHARRAVALIDGAALRERGLTAEQLALIVAQDLDPLDEVSSAHEVVRKIAGRLGIAIAEPGNQPAHVVSGKVPAGVVPTGGAVGLNRPDGRWTAEGVVALASWMGWPYSGDALHSELSRRIKETVKKLVQDAAPGVLGGREFIDGSLGKAVVVLAAHELWDPSRRSRGGEVAVSDAADLVREIITDLAGVPNPREVSLESFESRDEARAWADINAEHMRQIGSLLHIPGALWRHPDYDMLCVYALGALYNSMKTGEPFRFDPTGDLSRRVRPSDVVREFGVGGFTEYDGGRKSLIDVGRELPERGVGVAMWTVNGDEYHLVGVWRNSRGQVWVLDASTGLPAALPGGTYYFGVVDASKLDGGLIRLPGLKPGRDDGRDAQRRITEIVEPGLRRDRMSAYPAVDRATLEEFAQGDGAIGEFRADTGRDPRPRVIAASDDVWEVFTRLARQPNVDRVFLLEGARGGLRTWRLTGDDLRTRNVPEGLGGDDAVYFVDVADVDGNLIEVGSKPKAALVEESAGVVRELGRLTDLMYFVDDRGERRAVAERFGGAWELARVVSELLPSSSEPGSDVVVHRQLRRLGDVVRFLDAGTPGALVGYVGGIDAAVKVTGAAPETVRGWVSGVVPETGDAGRLRLAALERVVKTFGRTANIQRLDQRLADLTTQQRRQFDLPGDVARFSDVLAVFARTPASDRVRFVDDLARVLGLVESSSGEQRGGGFVGGRDRTERLERTNAPAEAGGGWVGARDESLDDDGSLAEGDLAAVGDPVDVLMGELDPFAENEQTASSVRLTPEVLRDAADRLRAAEPPRPPRTDAEKQVSADLREASKEVTDIGARRELAHSGNVFRAKYPRTWESVRVVVVHAAAGTDAALQLLTEWGLEFEGQRRSRDDVATLLADLMRRMREFPPGPEDKLTKDQRRLVPYLAEGMSEAQIADRLRWSRSRFDDQIEGLREDLGLESRAQVAWWAYNQRSSAGSGRLDFTSESLRRARIMLLAAEPRPARSEAERQILDDLNKASEAVKDAYDGREPARRVDEGTWADISVLARHALAGTPEALELINRSELAHLVVSTVFEDHTVEEKITVSAAYLVDQVVHRARAAADSGGSGDNAGEVKGKGKSRGSEEILGVALAAEFRAHPNVLWGWEKWLGEVRDAVDKDGVKSRASSEKSFGNYLSIARKILGSGSGSGSGAAGWVVATSGKYMFIPYAAVSDGERSAGDRKRLNWGTVLAEREVKLLAEFAKRPRGFIPMAEIEEYSGKTLMQKVSQINGLLRANSAGHIFIVNDDVRGKGFIYTSGEEGDRLLSRDEIPDVDRTQLRPKRRRYGWELLVGDKWRVWLSADAGQLLSDLQKRVPRRVDESSMQALDELHSVGVDTGVGNLVVGSVGGNLRLEQAGHAATLTKLDDPELGEMNYRGQQEARNKRGLEAPEGSRFVKRQRRAAESPVRLESFNHVSFAPDATPDKRLEAFYRANPSRPIPRRILLEGARLTDTMFKSQNFVVQKRLDGEGIDAGGWIVAEKRGDENAFLFVPKMSVADMPTGHRFTAVDWGKLLTPRLLEMLHFFAQEPGQEVSRTKLRESIRGQNSDDETGQDVDESIRNLNKVLRLHGAGIIVSHGSSKKGGGARSLRYTTTGAEGDRLVDPSTIEDLMTRVRPRGDSPRAAGLLMKTSGWWGWLMRDEFDVMRELMAAQRGTLVKPDVFEKPWGTLRLKRLERIRDQLNEVLKARPDPEVPGRESVGSGRVEFDRKEGMRFVRGPGAEEVKLVEAGDSWVGGVWTRARVLSAVEGVSALERPGDGEVADRIWRELGSVDGVDALQALAGESGAVYDGVARVVWLRASRGEAAEVVFKEILTGLVAEQAAAGAPSQVQEQTREQVWGSAEAGQRWTGPGWTSARVLSALDDVSGLPPVDSFLFPALIGGLLPEELTRDEYDAVARIVWHRTKHGEEQLPAVVDEIVSGLTAEREPAGQQMTVPAREQVREQVWGSAEAGQRWTGPGWTSARVLSALDDVSGLPPVDSFLFPALIGGLLPEELTRDEYDAVARIVWHRTKHGEEQPPAVVDEIVSGLTAEREPVGQQMTVPAREQAAGFGADAGGSAVTGGFPIRSLEGDPGAGSSGPRVGGPGPGGATGEWSGWPETPGPRLRWDRDLVLGMAARLAAGDRRRSEPEDAVLADAVRAAYERFDEPKRGLETRKFLGRRNLADAIQVIAVHAWKGRAEVWSFLPPTLPRDLNAFVRAMANVVAQDVKWAMGDPGAAAHMSAGDGGVVRELVIRRAVGQILSGLSEVARKFTDLDGLPANVRQERATQLAAARRAVGDGIDPAQLLDNGLTLEQVALVVADQVDPSRAEESARDEVRWWAQTLSVGPPASGQAGALVGDVHAVEPEPPVAVDAPRDAGDGVKESSPDALDLQGMNPDEVPDRARSLRDWLKSSVATPGSDDASTAVASGQPRQGEQGFVMDLRRPEEGRWTAEFVLQKANEVAGQFAAGVWSRAVGLVRDAAPGSLGGREWADTQVGAGVATIVASGMSRIDSPLSDAARSYADELVREIVTDLLGLPNPPVVTRDAFSREEALRWVAVNDGFASQVAGLAHHAGGLRHHEDYFYTCVLATAAAYNSRKRGELYSFGPTTQREFTEEDVVEAFKIDEFVPYDKAGLLWELGELPVRYSGLILIENSEKPDESHLIEVRRTPRGRLDIMDRRTGLPAELPDGRPGQYTFKLGKIVESRLTDGLVELDGLQPASADRPDPRRLVREIGEGRRDKVRLGYQPTLKAILNEISLARIASLGMDVDQVAGMIERRYNAEAASQVKPIDEIAWDVAHDLKVVKHRSPSLPEPVDVPVNDEAGDPAAAAGTRPWLYGIELFEKMHADVRRGETVHVLGDGTVGTRTYRVVAAGAAEQAANTVGEQVRAGFDYARAVHLAGQSRPEDLPAGEDLAIVTEPGFAGIVPPHEADPATEQVRISVQEDFRANPPEQPAEAPEVWTVEDVKALAEKVSATSGDRYSVMRMALAEASMRLLVGMVDLQQFAKAVIWHHRGDIRDRSAVRATVKKIAADLKASKADGRLINDSTTVTFEDSRGTALSGRDAETASYVGLTWIDKAFPGDRERDGADSTQNASSASSGVEPIPGAVRRNLPRIVLHVYGDASEREPHSGQTKAERVVAMIRETVGLMRVLYLTSGMPLSGAPDPRDVPVTVVSHGEDELRAMPESSANLLRRQVRIELDDSTPRAESERFDTWLRNQPDTFPVRDLSEQWKEEPPVAPRTEEERRFPQLPDDQRLDERSELMVALNSNEGGPGVTPAVYQGIRGALELQRNFHGDGAKSFVTFSPQTDSGIEGLAAIIARVRGAGAGTFSVMLGYGASSKGRVRVLLNLGRDEKGDQVYIVDPANGDKLRVENLETAPRKEFENRQRDGVTVRQEVWRHAVRSVSVSDENSVRWEIKEIKEIRQSRSESWMRIQNPVTREEMPHDDLPGLLELYEVTVDARGNQVIVAPAEPRYRQITDAPATASQFGGLRSVKAEGLVEALKAYEKHSRNPSDVIARHTLEQFGIGDVGVREVRQRMMIARHGDPGRPGPFAIMLVHAIEEPRPEAEVGSHRRKGPPGLVLPRAYVVRFDGDELTIVDPRTGVVASPADFGHAGVIEAVGISVSNLVADPVDADGEYVSPSEKPGGAGNSGARVGGGPGDEPVTEDDPNRPFGAGQSGSSTPAADADPAGQLLRELNEATLSDPASAGVLPEPDLFGLLTPANPPEFLRGHDYSEITAGQGLDLLQRLDLKRPAPNWSDVAPHNLQDLDDFVLTRELPEHERGWAENETPLPAELQLLRARASIWLGGPLDTSSPAKVELRKNIAESEKQLRGWAPMVVFTDVPRAQFEEAAKVPVDHEPDSLAGVREMLAWAEDNNVALVNVHEVFNSSWPMPHQEAFLAELAKQTKPGYTASSDYLRVALGQRFGLPYSDGEYQTTWQLLDEMQQVLDSDEAYGIHKRGGTVNNDLLVLPKGHPFADKFFDRMSDNYGKTQAEVHESPDFLPAESFVTNPQLRSRRYSVISRTGPINIAKLADELGHGGGDRGAITGPAMNTGGQWVTRPRPQPSISLQDRAATVELTQKVVQTLARELHNRDGDLHLTLVADAVHQHEAPDVIWTAALGYLAQRPEIAGLVRTVTDRELVSITSDQHEERRVELPEQARQYLRFLPGEETHRLAEYSRPAKMTQDLPGPDTASDGAAGQDHEGGSDHHNP